MTHPELSQECVHRGIEMPAGTSNRAQATRAQMIIMMQDHAKDIQETLVAGGDWQMEDEGSAAL